MLSNKNEKVYYNPTDNKLLVSVTGTDKFSPKAIMWTRIWPQVNYKIQVDINMLIILL